MPIGTQGFKKGHRQFNTGITHFKRGHISFSSGKRMPLTCYTCKNEFLVIQSRKNAKYCSKKCVGVSIKGKSPWNKGLKGFRLGEKRPNIMPMGDKHWSWKGGVSRDTHSTKEPRYKNWRMAVFKRDSFSCRIENIDCKGQIQVHHILRWADYPELRYEINNGITLCQAHHPLKRAEEKRLIPLFRELVSVSN